MNCAREIPRAARKCPFGAAHRVYLVAVGIRISPYPPHRSGQADFPHPALASGGDAQTARGIRMADTGRRKPTTDEPFHSLPLDATMLASPAQSAMPEVAHGETKMSHGMTVTRYSEITKMPAHNGLQPRANFRNRVMHSPPQLDLDVQQLRLHALANRLPKHQKPPSLRLPADMLEAEEIEGLRLAQTEHPRFPTLSAKEGGKDGAPNSVGMPKTQCWRNRLLHLKQDRLRGQRDCA